MQEKINIVCLLFNGWGGPDPSKYVERLFNMIDRHTTKEFEFHCFTDIPERLFHLINKIHVRLLPEFDYDLWKFNLPKFYIHRGGLFPVGSQVFLFDLDTVIVDNIDDMLDYDGEFCGIKPFLKKYQRISIGGGFLSFKSGRTAHFWDIVSTDPEGWASWSQGGKERLILSNFAKNMKWEDRWQDLYPDKLVSYKMHCRKTNEIPEGASIVALHGNPRPHELPKHDAVGQLWK